MGTEEFVPPSDVEAAQNDRTEVKLKGIPASGGIAIGPVFYLEEQDGPLIVEAITDAAIESELTKFENARQRCSREIEAFITKARRSYPTAVPILEAQLVILNDPLLLKRITSLIYQHHSAASAVLLAFNEQEKKLLQLRDPLFRDRALDLEDVKDRILSILRNEQISLALPEHSILVARTLTPSEVLLIKEKNVAAIALENDSLTSHPIILARSLQIPAVVGIRTIMKQARSAEQIIVDGYSGTVIINPSTATIEQYQQRRRSLKRFERRNKKLREQPAITRDKRKLTLYANADSVEDIELALTSGAEGIGLLRTELLLSTSGGNGFPEEEELTEQYREIAARVYPRPVTFRLFDLTEDKLPNRLLFLREPNPALGLRGIRLLLKHRSLLGAQLRAILRASQHRNVRILIPMVSSVDEVLKVTKLVKRFAATLEKQQLPIDPNLPIGIMLETPAAALLASKFAPMVHFMSIGSNDLTQYTMAADRSGTFVGHYYDPFHPAVLTLIASAIDAARAYNIEITICGEFAGHPLATDALIGMGISGFSVTPSLILSTKKRIRAAVYQSAQHLARRLLELTTAEEVRSTIMAYRKAQKQQTPELGR